MRLTVSPGPIVQKKIWIFSGNIFGVIWADCSKKNWIFLGNIFGVMFS